MKRNDTQRYEERRSDVISTSTLHSPPNDTLSSLIHGEIIQAKLDCRVLLALFNSESVPTTMYSLRVAGNE